MNSLCLLIFLPSFLFHESPHSLWLSVKWLRRSLHGARHICTPDMKSRRAAFPRMDTRNKRILVCVQPRHKCAGRLQLERNPVRVNLTFMQTCVYDFLNWWGEPWLLIILIIQSMKLLKTELLQKANEVIVLASCGCSLMTVNFSLVFSDVPRLGMLTS